MDNFYEMGGEILEVYINSRGVREQEVTVFPRLKAGCVGLYGHRNSIVTVCSDTESM